jgi:hypothetical protein
MVCPVCIAPIIAAAAGAGAAGGSIWNSWVFWVSIVIFLASTGVMVYYMFFKKSCGKDDDTCPLKN